MKQISSIAKASLCMLGSLVFTPSMAVAQPASSQPTTASVPTITQAPVAILVDITSGQTLFEREANRRFLPASITKVMTVYLAFELMEQGKLNAQQSFNIRPETHAEWYRKGSTMFLPADQPVLVDDLIRGISTISANDGSVVLAESAAGSVENWVQMMNDKATEIGMINSRFGTPNGWPDEGKTFVTARDLVTLSQALIGKHADKYDEYFGHKGFRYAGIGQANHDPLVGKVEGADGIKTGFTNEAGYGFLGSVERSGQRLVMVVGGAASEEARAVAAQNFIEWGFANFQSRQLFDANIPIGVARVQAGSESSIELVSTKPVRIAVPTGTDPEVTLKIRYHGPLKAPIKAGQSVASLEVEVEGMPNSSIPLTAAKGVDRASFFGHIANGFAGWFS